MYFPGDLSSNSSPSYALQDKTTRAGLTWSFTAIKYPIAVSKHPWAAKISAYLL